MPFLILFVEALLFSRYLIFTRDHVIPWDLRFYHLPHAIFISRSLHDGELPLWNPFIYCGMPFAANIQTALFYPLRILAVIGGTLTSEDSMIRWLEADWIASMFLAGIFAYLLARRLKLGRTGALLAATTYQLGAFFASQAQHIGAIEIAAWIPLVWLGAIDLPKLRSFLLLSAAVAMSFLGGFTPLTLVVLMSSLLFLPRQALPKALAAWFASICFGTMLAAAAVLPAAQLRAQSVSQFRTDWMGTGGGIPLSALRTLLLPNAPPLPGDPTFQYLYCGIISLVLAVLGLRSKFGALAIVFALLMLGDSTAVGTIFHGLIPGFIQDAYYPQQWLAPFSLSLAICAGFGLEQLRTKYRFAALLLPLAAIDLLWFNSARPINLVSITRDPGVSMDAFHGSKDLKESVKRHTGPGRLDTMNDSIDWVASAMVTGIPTAGGQDPMALVRYMQVRDIFCNGKRFGVYYQVKDIHSQILNLLNVSSIVTRTRPPLPYGVVPGGYVYRNESALPRFYLASAIRMSTSMDESVASLRAEPMMTVVEGREEIPVAGGTVKLAHYRRNSIDLDVDMKESGYLVSSEVNYPGWGAKIDGQDARVFNTNVAFRGLIVPGGKHHIQFSFVPLLLYFSILISAVSWSVWGVAMWATYRRSKMPR